MSKIKKANITGDELLTLAEKAVENARARRATALEEAQLEDATGGLKVMIGGIGQTDGLVEVPKF
jgi:hypothetical protein